MNDRRLAERPLARRALGAMLLAVLLSAGLLGCDLANSDVLDKVKVEFVKPTPTRVVGKAGDRLTIPLQVQTSFDGSVLALVPVYIDGNGPYNFALDTGASRSLIDQRLAEELNLPTVGRAQPVLGVFGGGEAALVAVRDWQVGEVDLPCQPGRGRRLARAQPRPGPTRAAGLGHAQHLRDGDHRLHQRSAHPRRAVKDWTRRRQTRSRETKWSGRRRRLPVVARGWGRNEPCRVSRLFLLVW